jgi:hypothetical protein
MPANMYLKLQNVWDKCLLKRTKTVGYNEEKTLT